MRRAEDGPKCVCFCSRTPDGQYRIVLAIGLQISPV
jgi:hypothetical protein